MTPRELKQARHKLRLTASKMGRMLGYVGPDVGRMVRHLEAGTRTLREPQRRLVEAYLAGYRPPDWPGKDT